MKNILFLFLICSSLFVSAQNLTVEFDKNFSDYKITTKSKKVRVYKQMIWEQSYQYFDKRLDQFVTTKEYSLQIISRDQVKEISLAELKSRKTYTGELNLGGKGYFVKLLDNKKNLLYEIYQPMKDFDMNYNSGESGFYFYSIALRNFPIIMMDVVREVNIEVVR